MEMFLFVKKLPFLYLLFLVLVDIHGVFCRQRRSQPPHQYATKTKRELLDNIYLHEHDVYVSHEKIVNTFKHIDEDDYEDEVILQKNQQQEQKSFNQGQTPSFIKKKDMLLDARTFLPLSIYNMHFPVFGNTAREKADYFLKSYDASLDGKDSNVKLFSSIFDSALSSSSSASPNSGRDSLLQDLQFVNEQKTLMWTTVRYRQMYRGIPLYNGYVSVTINDDTNEARLFQSNYKMNVRLLMSDSDTENVINETEEGLFSVLPTPKISRQKIYIMASTRFSQSIFGLSSFNADLFMFYDEGMTSSSNSQTKSGGKRRDISPSKLVWRVQMKLRRTISESSNVHDSWEVLFDANDGTVVLQRNLTHEARHEKKENYKNLRPSSSTTLNTKKLDDENNASTNTNKSNTKRKTQEIPIITDFLGDLSDFIDQNRCIDGTTLDAPAYVFDPDPISTSSATYGTGGFIDNSDKTNDDLDDQLKEVTLRDITCSDRGVYKLTGPNVDIVDLTQPCDGNFEQKGNSDFRFTRDHPSFEAVMAYYHIDTFMRYVKDDLGLGVEPYQYGGEGVRVDPHGAGDDVNAYYISACGTLHFGQGGVDAAEDASVIIHELSHAFHDWLTGGGLSQVDGLSEGMADYIAGSYMRAKNLWSKDQDEYYWFSHWFGHNEFWVGRRLDYDKIWPYDIVDSIHINGQIWSSANMRVWDVLGREKSDTAHLLGISSLNVFSGQEEAASAVLAAVEDLGYSEVEISEMNSIYRDYGYNVICGDGVVEGIEQCEIDDVTTQSSSCEDVGCTGGGTPTCLDNGYCLLDYSDCLPGEDEIKFTFDAITNIYSSNFIQFQEHDANATTAPLISYPALGPETKYEQLTACVVPSGCFQFTIDTTAYDSSGEIYSGIVDFNITINGTDVPTDIDDFEYQINHHFCFY